MDIEFASAFIFIRCVRGNASHGFVMSLCRVCVFIAFYRVSARYSCKTHTNARTSHVLEHCIRGGANARRRCAMLTNELRP